MPLFSSNTERRYWISVMIVIVAIFSTLFLGQPLLHLLGAQQVQAGLFLLGMLLVGATVFIYGWNIRSNKPVLFPLLGILAVYLLLFLRLGLAERSHLIEYGVLTVFTYQALRERLQQEKESGKIVVLWTFFFAVSIGVLDECLQLLLPSRVFDGEDIIFNILSISMSLATLLILRKIRKRVH